MFGRVLPRLLALLKTSVSVASARFFSIALFALSARHLSPDENGAFIYAITLPQLLVQLGTLGWLNVIRREVARRADSPSSLFKGFVIRSIQVPMIAILLIGFCLACISLVTSDTPHLYGYTAAITIAYAAVMVLREYLIALGYPAFSIGVAETLPFAFAFAAIWFIRPAHAEGAAFLFLVGLVLSCVIQIPAVFKALQPFLKPGEPQYETKAWMRTGGFSLLGFGGRTVLDRLDTIVLATLAPAIQFAYYNSAQRATALLLVAPMVLLPVFSPHLSKAFALKDSSLLRRDMFLQTILVAFCVLPLAALLILFPKEIMGLLFGARYETSTQILGLIVFSQVMFAFSLPWSNLMLMSDGEKIYGYAHIGVLILVLPVALGLVGSWGAYAIALSSLVANAILLALFFGLGMHGLMSRDESERQESQL